MATMRAVDIRGGKGEIDDLFINPNTPQPTPTTGQALVRIKAFGINRMDILQRRGLYPLPRQAPTTLGVELSGVVEALGPGSHQHSGRTINVGDEVFGLAYGGAYAELIAMDSRMLLHKPKSLSWQQAAAVPEAWITATQALDLILGFTAGRSILWHAGASGVSTAGIQLSRLAGASAVYATAGSDEKCALLTSKLGADGAFNYKTCDWSEAVLKATGGRGVDYIVDFVGGDYFMKNLAAAALDCRIVILATLGGSRIPDADIGPILRKRIRIEGSTLRSRDLDYQAMLRDRLEARVPQFEAGQLDIFLDCVLPWEKIQDAHRHMEEAKNSGKIVCTIS
ncbi:hypothetical protein CDD81_5293 [Ophiocordyceps australis]|uniref:Enoyl reductase (ER) domain-containing protein n=1 Tax=Ophiocordyceps australis TaxID=1399860 RepID=A0A2C5YJ62_9HYPO|nr:hypothetical protein CDD81_5293 [Ophiocordyceps australis]